MINNALAHFWLERRGQTVLLDVADCPVISTCGNSYSINYFEAGYVLFDI
jgi:hypothetical protein